jgi:hypothetical protein
MHFGVLRVLTEQTLEISSMVKNPTFPNPSLVMEVKYSSLTILHQLPFSFRGSLRKHGTFLVGFCRARVHFLE